MSYNNNVNHQTNILYFPLDFRGEEWHTVSQYVTLSVNSTYYFECWVKPLNISSGQQYMTGQLVAHMESESSKLYEGRIYISALTIFEVFAKCG